MYLDLLNNQPKYMHKFIWKMKVPLKIKIFMWFIHRKVILTKDNLMKRIGMGTKNVVFVTKMNQYNTSFSVVGLREQCGE